MAVNLTIQLSDVDLNNADLLYLLQLAAKDGVQLQWDGAGAAARPALTDRKAKAKSKAPKKASAKKASSKKKAATKKAKPARAAAAPKAKTAPKATRSSTPKSGASKAKSAASDDLGYLPKGTIGRAKKVGLSVIDGETLSARRKYSAAARKAYLAKIAAAEKG